MEIFASGTALIWLGRFVPIALGAAGGYLYYRFIGCKSGACPLTGNPWISTIYGGLIGAMFIH